MEEGRPASRQDFLLTNRGPGDIYLSTRKSVSLPACQGHLILEVGMIRDVDLLASAKTGPRRAGRKELIAYLEGGKISRPGAVKAKCYDCNGMGESGECDSEGCPLYPFSPYKTRNTAVSAKSKGKATDTGVSVDQSSNSKSQNAENGIIGGVS